MSSEKNDCPHEKIVIVVLDAWDIHEQIGFKCVACKKILKKTTN